MYARCVLNFCIVTYFRIRTYLVCVCYMIVAIKPMYFVMYKIVYFCWKTFSGKSQYHNTKYMYEHHNLHSSASWNFPFFNFFKVQCKLNLICGNRKVPVKFQLLTFTNKFAWLVCQHVRRSYNIKISMHFIKSTIIFFP